MVKKLLGDRQDETPQKDEFGNDVLPQEDTIFDKIRESIQGQAVAIVRKKQGELSNVDLECGTFTFSSEIEFRNNLDTFSRKYGGGLYKVFVKTMQGKFAQGIPAPMFFNYADSTEKPTAPQGSPNFTINPPEKDKNEGNFYLSIIEAERNRASRESEKADKFLQLMLSNQQAMQTAMQNFMSNIQAMIMTTKQQEVKQDAVETLIKLKTAGLLPDSNKGLTGQDIKELITTGIDLASVGVTGKGDDKGLMGDIAEIVKTAVELLGTRNKLMGRKLNTVPQEQILKTDIPNKELPENTGGDMVVQPKKPELKNEIEETVYKNSAIFENFSNYGVNVQAVAEAILKQIPEAFDEKLLNWLKTEPQRIYDVLPFLSNNKQWTEELKEVLIKVLSIEKANIIDGENNADKDD